VREGFSKKEDTMPPRMCLDPLPDGNAKGKVVTMQNFEKMLTEYYHLWGWDDQGKLNASTIHELGLTELTI
jgi:aldehyde:ferredoxin oxidoreductase